MGFFYAIFAGDQQHSACGETCSICERHFVVIRGGAASCALHCNSIGADVFHINGRKVDIDIGREVVSGIADFVHQLFDDGISIYRSASAFGLSDHAGTIVVDFGDWIADVCQIEILPMAIQSAGYLGAALDQMSGDATARQAIPIVPLPAEFVSGGPTVSDASATRPVMTIRAPLDSASAIGCAPRYALALTIGRPNFANGCSVSRFSKSAASRLQLGQAR